VALSAPPVGLQDHAELAARLTTEINHAGATA